VTCFKRECGQQTRETESLGHSKRKFALTLFLFEPDFYVVLKVLPKQTFIEEISFRLSNRRFLCSTVTVRSCVVYFSRSGRILLRPQASFIFEKPKCFFILPELNSSFTTLCTQLCCTKRKQSVVITGIRYHFVNADSELLECKLCTFPIIAVSTNQPVLLTTLCSFDIFLRSDLKPLLILLALIYQRFDSHDMLRMYIICLRSDVAVIFCHWRRTLKTLKFSSIQNFFICRPLRCAILRSGIYYYRL
jgi:hypothetical protein